MAFKQLKIAMRISFDVNRNIRYTKGNTQPEENTAKLLKTNKS